MNYILIEADDLEGLSSEVNRMMNEGYTVNGAPFKDRSFFQSMIMDDYVDHNMNELNDHLAKISKRLSFIVGLLDERLR